MLSAVQVVFVEIASKTTSFSDSMGATGASISSVQTKNVEMPARVIYINIFFICLFRF